jgi:hypothetical protein
MKENEFLYFQKLKEKIESKYKSVYTDCYLTIKDWKVIEIRNFQALMQKEVNSRISEKWFYTHLKTDVNEKLPRIDTLNLLCEFVGFTNWEDFVAKNEIKTVDTKKIKVIVKTEKKIKTKTKLLTILLSSAIILTIIIYTAITAFAQKSYKFCFIDADTKEKIKSDEIEIILLNDNESPQILESDKSGCFTIETQEQNISFIVKAPYYKTDTITRVLTNKNEEIHLKTDDYALMIHIFSTSKIEDWEKRKKQLEEMISDDAHIFQVDKKNNGMEMYNKEDFINKMIIPLNSLKNIKIIETNYRDGKIGNLRFIQEEE